MNQQTQSKTTVKHIVLTPCRLRPIKQRQARPIVPTYDQLSKLLRRGLKLHPLARGSFIKKHVTGCYHYDRKEQLQTCALVAAYVGAFGSDALTLPFSHSMACFQLEGKIGYRVDGYEVTNPANGRMMTVSKCMQCLVDDHWWNRRGVADWLESIRL